jgi:hypothetical protein
MSDGHSELIAKMAGLLREWADYLVRENKQNLTAYKKQKLKGKPSEHLTGDRAKQYAVMDGLYALITNNRHFSIGAEKKGIQVMTGKEKLKRAGEVTRVVNLAFRRAYGEDARSKRQQAHVWGTVLSSAWYQNIDQADFDLFLFKSGGIHKVYMDSKDSDF